MRRDRKVKCYGCGKNGDAKHDYRSRHLCQWRVDKAFHATRHCDVSSQWMAVRMACDAEGADSDWREKGRISNQDSDLPGKHRNREGEATCECLHVERGEGN
jgi:hypothetical protein